LFSWSSAPKYKDKKKYSRSQKQKIRLATANDYKKQDVEKICRAAMHFECGCGNFCLATVGDTVTESLSMLVEYMTPWMIMSRKEHREKFFPILEGCARGVTEGGHLDKR
jgi:hypothetical protein